MASSNFAAYLFDFVTSAGESSSRKIKRLLMCNTRNKVSDRDKPMIIKWGFYSSSSNSGLNYRNIEYSCNCYDFCSFHSQNEPSWSASEIAAAVNGEVIKWGPSGTICTDSRILISGQWFFAIAGKRFDGHDFVNQALEDKGCMGVIGNRVCEKWQRGFIKVEGDTSIALENLAKYARKRFGGHVVGLTGSVGKTTTRNMVALAVERLGQAYQTHGNQNNHIGVAFTLIGIPLGARVLVLELGMDRKGDILELARICLPSLRVILNVGHCHMENFGSLHEVAEAKGELLLEAKPGDVCVLNADDPLVMNLTVPDGVKKVFFGQSAGSDVRLVSAENIDGGSAIRVILENRMCGYDRNILASDECPTDVVEFQICCPGLHLAINACAAAAIAVSLGVPLSQVGDSLSRFKPVHMRSELETTKNGIRIINDAYNANPTSMAAAIDLVQAMDCRGRRVAILGDMLELGAMEAEAHEAVLNLCHDASLDLVVLVGRRFLSAAGKLDILGKSNVLCAVDSETIALEITERLTSGDVVLVKGSRAMQMEKVVDAIKAIHI